jgi:hypothetical protein
MIAEQLTPAALVLIAQKGLELAARVDIHHGRADRCRWHVEGRPK